MCILKKYGSFSKNYNHSEKENPQYTSKEENTIDYFFKANSADHNLSQYHIVFHSFLILAITSSNEPMNKLVVSILGLVSSVISFFTFMRSDAFKKFWKDKMPESLRKFDSTLKFKCVKHSRIITIIILFFVYLFFLIISLRCLDLTP